MFSALSNLGAGGTQDIHLSNIANSVLYGCFFIGGFFAGSINVSCSYTTVRAVIDIRLCRTHLVPG